MCVRDDKSPNAPLPVPARAAEAPRRRRPGAVLVDSGRPSRPAQPSTGRESSAEKAGTTGSAVAEHAVAISVKQVIGDMSDWSLPAYDVGCRDVLTDKPDLVGSFRRRRCLASL
ncbi:hypothetical protein Vse01_40550 [Micromonospora sediminimaris]|uniref:Uncharacterized protein n=1 Tax=Micromonospora sediminimaris TaxID=547162 RepID=A0A9W5XLC8_9ACTN|nr:hypothetical protein Vse01_40550 [Micromonospora sediminimaris]